MVTPKNKVPSINTFFTSQTQNENAAISTKDQIDHKY